MKCPNCDKKLTNERIEHAIEKRGTQREVRKNHNIYCNNTCFRAYKHKNKDDRLCPECGLGPIGPMSKRCAPCRAIGVSKHRLDSEIKELVVLNPGAGFSYFIDMVFGKNGKYKGRPQMRHKLSLFLQDLQEVDGVDYIGWLQNPDAMRVVKQDNVPDELEKYMKGQRRSVPSGHVRRRRIRNKEPTRESGSLTVKIPRKFKWGKYKPL